MGEVIEKLNISRSTIYRMLPNIKRALKANYTISIDSTPFSFTGDEMDIRFFLTQFTAERYLDELPYPSHFDSTLLNDFLTMVSDIYDFDLNYMSIIGKIFIYTLLKPINNLKLLF